MKRTALTDKAILAARPTTLGKNGKPATQLTDGGGLYLKLQWSDDGKAAGKGHQWRFDYTRPTTGKRNTMSLGAYPSITLAEARVRAQAARDQVARGVDPCEVKEAAKAEQKAAVLAVVVSTERAAQGFASAGTLLGVCEDYHTGKTATGEWFKDHADKWIAAVRRALPGGKHYNAALRQHLDLDLPLDIANMPIAQVKPKHILRQVIRPLEMVGMDASSRVVRKSLAAVFDYAEVMELREGNPARSIASQCKKNIQQANNPAAITPEDLTTVLRAIVEYRGPVVSACLEAQVALFQRPNTTAAMRWADVDLDAARWTIKAEERTKIHKSLRGDDHLVPLPRQMVELLRSLKPLTGHTEFVFYSPMNTGKSLDNQSMNQALRIMGFSGKQTPHGFRATARTMIPKYLGRSLPGFDKDWVEAQLAHTSTEEQGTAYDRNRWFEERAEMLQAWADYLDRLVSPVLLPEQPTPQQPLMLEAA